MKKVYILVIIALIVGVYLGLEIAKFTNKEPVNINNAIILDNPKQVELTIVAVDDNNQGVSSTLITEIQPGNGLILVNINDVLADFLTQLSARNAAKYASSYMGIDNLENLDIIYTIKANASIIGGPSAGSAMAISTILALKELQPRRDVIITGAIDEQGNILKVGSIPEKAQAAKEAGASLFLIPSGNKQVSNIMEAQRQCTDFGNLEYCVIEYIPKEVKIEEEGLIIKEVSTIKEALEYFTNEAN